MENFSNDSVFSERNFSETEIESTIDDNEEKIFSQESIKNHIVYGTRNEDSSIDSVKINLNEITFDKNKEENKVLKKSFHPLDNLEKKKFTEIYNILCNSQMLIFVDNYKLEKKHNCMTNLIRNKIDLINEEFPGCTFFPYEYVNILKKNIHILNNNILDGEFKNTKIYNDNELCFNICFDEGEILKKILYKKMEINNKILFVPISKYQLKQTEYRIRGFCQIVEELGAKKIEIKFKKNNIITTKKSVDATLGSDIEVIAGSLGLSNSNKSDENEDYSYTLDYPSNNTILLNEKTLRKKIKKKKYIISEDAFNSNLELQYVIRSRCRHFITKYSTVFTFDNSFTIDNKIISKLASHNIKLGIEVSKNTNKKHYLQIVTDVTFSDQKDYSNHLAGHSVSLNKTGFAFLIDSINNENFRKDGIYKIMEFISLYVKKVLKYSPEKEYRYTNTILKKIKKNLTIEEYAMLLCNYFNLDSQWIHFENFIELLAFKTQSYDKLGYLIIMNQNDICLNDKIIIITKFIQQKCIEENIELKYWQMLHPHKSELKYFLNNKLINDYDFVKNYNWYSLMSLINDIKDYNVDLDNLDELDKFIKIKKNMKLGYKQYEFTNIMVPFIIRKSYQLEYYKNDIYKLSKLLELSLNYESFIVNKTDNISELEDYIKKKLDRIVLGYEMINKFKDDILVDKELNINIDIKLIKDYFISKRFDEKYDYIFRKLNIIIPNLDSKFLDNFLLTTSVKNLQSCDIVNIENLFYFIFKRIFGYNEKLNIKNVPPNLYGFKLVMNRYYLGIKEIEFERIVKPFISKIITNVIQIEYTYDSNEYKLLNSFNIFDIINFEYFNSKCNNYLNLITNIKTILTNELGLILCNSLLNNLFIS